MNHCDIGVHLADLFGRASEGSTLRGAEDIVLHGFGGPTRELKFVIDVGEMGVGPVGVDAD